MPRTSLPRVVFARNPLKVVVAQLKFPAVFALAQPTGVAQFQQAIEADYPLNDVMGQVDVQLAPNPGLGIPQAPTWRFFPDGQAWIVGVSVSSLSLETKTYTRFEEFRDRFSTVLKAAVRTMPITRCTRLGLRYVNQIEHPEAVTLSDWTRFLNERLFGLATDDALDARVSQALQQISVEIPDGKATIRHGYSRKPSGEGSTYVIDIDVYDEQQMSLDPDAIVARLAQWKEWEWQRFRGSISDALAEYLGSEPLETAGASDG